MDFLVVLSWTEHRNLPYRSVYMCSLLESWHPQGHEDACAVQNIYESLPEGTVQFGQALSGFSQDDSGVRLSFEGQPDVHAKFLIAADGYLSPTREILLNDGPPPFAVQAACLPARILHSLSFCIFLHLSFCVFYVSIFLYLFFCIFL